MSFTHLHVHSNFSFLDGGSDIQSLCDRALSVGCKALAITDKNGVYGAIRFYNYAKKIGIKPIIGSELDVENPAGEKHHIILIAKDLAGYSNLCKIITRAHLSREKGEAAANMEIFAKYASGLFCLSGCPRGEVPTLLRENKLQEAEDAANRYISIFGRENYLIELQDHVLPGTRLLNTRLDALAKKLGLRCVATNNVHYAQKEDFKLHDILSCVRTLTKLDERHPERKQNSEYYLKTPQEMAQLFRAYPKAVVNTQWLARQCNLDLALGTYRFPDYPLPDGETAYSYLCKLCFDALPRLYQPITPKVTQRLQHELETVHKLGFEEYFLAVWDIVRFAKSQNIRCLGRGSAADSLVAYCLGITIVDPIACDLLFERFMNPERRGMPDIDIDFDAARRDEVIDYIYDRFGEDKVAMVCTVSTFKARSALRDLGKAMEYPEDDVDRLASSLPHYRAKHIRDAIEKFPELKDGNLPMDRLDSLVDICEKVDRYPRHLSVHLAGVVIGKDVLTDLVPLEWATKGVIVTQFDKDDIEALGLVKMDILALCNLTAIEDAISYIKDTRKIDLDIDNIPLDDSATYGLLRSTNTIGCFQVESPGMRGLLGRLQPDCFDDVIAQISLFRPGPMQADMIAPFIARKHGDEPVSYLHPSLENALRETYGVILYQEQVLKCAHALAGFTYGQADSFRRAMTTDRSKAEMEKIREGFMESALKNGVDEETAALVFSKLSAFAAYGFCKAHAASFGKTAYQTAYLKAHYPAEFLAGIMNSQPMGFYPPNVIMEEARRIGIDLLGVDINESGRRYKVTCDSSGTPAIRVALIHVRNISQAEVDSIISARDTQKFSSFSDFFVRTRIERPTIENLVNCGVFDCFNVPRGKLLWLMGELVRSRRGRMSSAKKSDESAPSLISDTDIFDIEDQVKKLPDVPEPSLHERVRIDYDILGFSTICHPMTFYREKLKKANVLTTAEAKERPHNSIVRVAGVVVVCMRPPTRSGTVVVFVTLEDECGVIDTVTFPKAYAKYGTTIFRSPALIIEGRLQKMGKKGFSLSVNKVLPLEKHFLTDNAPDLRPFAERIRTAGARSFVRGTGV